MSRYYAPRDEDRSYQDWDNDKLLAGLADLLKRSEEPWAEQSKTRIEDAGPGDRVNYTLARPLPGRKWSAQTAPILKIKKNRQGDHVVVLGRRDGPTKQRAWPSQVKLAKGSQVIFDDEFMEDMEPIISKTKKLTINDRKSACAHYIKGACLYDGRSAYNARLTENPEEAVAVDKVVDWLVATYDEVEQNDKKRLNKLLLKRVAEMLRFPGETIFELVLGKDIPEGFDEAFRKWIKDGCSYAMTFDQVKENKSWTAITAMADPKNIGKAKDWFKQQFKSLDPDVVSFFTTTSVGAVGKLGKTKIKAWAKKAAAYNPEDEDDSDSGDDSGDDNV